MKRIAAIALLAAFGIATAQSLRIQYTPPVGTKTTYRTVTTTGAQMLDFAAQGISAQQQTQLRQQLVAASSTRTEVNTVETVAAVNPDGSRRVTGVVSMTITTPASPQPINAGFNTVTLYRADGPVDVQEFKLDRARTNAQLAAALEQNSASFKNLYTQSSQLAFYGKTLGSTPVVVTAEIPAPAAAASLNLKYRARNTFTLLGRTPSGGARIGVTTQLEPVNYSGKQNAVDITLRLTAAPATGEITLLPDGRVERATVPSDLTLNATTSAASGGLRYSLRIKTNTEINLVR
jgi:hypothetical protein